MNAATCVCALLLLCTVASAAEKAAGFDAFELTRTRNIFDPNRRAIRKESEQARPQTAATRPRSVHLILTGTLVTDQRTLAFFTGSNAEFNKIGSSGDKLGVFTIGQITVNDVELKDGDKVTRLTVGKRLQLEGTEADATEPEPGTTNTTTTAPEAPAPTTPAAPAGNASEILKRMMERRAQEMKK